MADLTCDLILKGGLTSGVVYPPAVCRLSETYRLVNIGGASAGAIAAAATAAAEFGRQHGGGGYAVLAALPADLGAKGKSGDTALLSLFEPQARTRPLFRVLLAALGGGLTRIAGTALFAELTSAAGWWRVLTGALPGVAVVLLAVFATAFPWSIVLGVLGALLLVAGVFAGTAWALVRRLLVDVPGNFLGVVNGSGSAAALTPWLTALIDRAAGREGPLTLADLWGASDKHRKWLCYADPGLRRINLEVMTTNLGEGRPQRLPLLSDGYFFHEGEFRLLFPDRVVDVMTHAEDIVPREPADQRAYDELTRLAADRGYRRMPLADLPVVVAARLSLSFPVLLSAVPLYTFTVGADRTLTRSRCWISDGGITSNMPLHFFDAPLPQRPTFAVNLRPDDTVGTDAGPTLPGFVKAIATTMQNWVDNAQMQMPGYRERIYTVQLKPGEGGMNLDMGDEQINALAADGRKAADSLLSSYAEPPADGWRNHRWVRYRTLMAMVERLFGQLHDAWDAHPATTVATYHEMAEDSGRPPAYPFPADADAWVRLRADELAALATVWPDPAGGSFRTGEPMPRPLWRAQPEL